MKNKKTLLAIPLMAIALVAVGLGMTSNIFAQTTTTIRTTFDPQDGPNATNPQGNENEAADITENSEDNHSDGETTDD